MGAAWGRRKLLEQVRLVRKTKSKKRKTQALPQAATRKEAAAIQPKVNTEAETVATWAFRCLLQNGGHKFPFENSFPWSGKLGFKSSGKNEAKRAARPLRQLEDSEAFGRFVVWKETLERARKRAEEILTRTDNKSVRNWVAGALFDAGFQFNKLLLQIAEADDPYALEFFAGISLDAVIQLELLARRNLKLVKPIARKVPFWPVVGSPHKDTRQEVEAMIKRLEVGRDAPENVWGWWSNMPKEKQPYRRVLGTYVARIMTMLRRVKDQYLFQARFQAELRGHAGPNQLSPDECAQLIRRGWPKWIVDAACLPKFSNESAKDWFEVGWAALKEAAGGNVASIKELEPVGFSRAHYESEKGSSQRIQGSQRQALIHDRLRDAFLARFRLTP